MSPVKIFNDPVHGFIEIPRNFLLRIIDHPWFQRLRRIRQGGMNSLVYAGSTHTRFSHAMGAMHLTRVALDTLRKKDVEITEAEYEGALAAILLHDAGHGPFSHSLEGLLAPGVPHEQLSLEIMLELNRELAGALDLAIDIFLGRHPKPFLHELVSSQLDMDRMDYLMRDSFFTGVQEGIVGTERIIKTLDARDGRLVVEQKGIYSAEKFIIARRLMYWQVYLHKTALSAEQMLVRAFRRARQLRRAGAEIWRNEALDFFLALPETPENPPEPGAELLRHFLALDDTDITYALKQWSREADPALRELAPAPDKPAAAQSPNVRPRPEPAREIASAYADYYRAYRGIRAISGMAYFPGQGFQSGLYLRSR